MGILSFSNTQGARSSTHVMEMAGFLQKPQHPLTGPELPTKDRKPTEPSWIITPLQIFLINKPPL